MLRLLPKHSKKLLSVKNVTVSMDGLKLLQNVSFDLNQGDILSVIGPNGAGKTTLIKAILGLIPFSGSVRLLDKPARKNLSKIGYVPQKLNFDRTFPLTVEEFLNLSKPGFKIKEDKVCKKLKVTDLASKLIGELSGGQLQRVMITRAMLNNPDLLIFDEPTSGVDVNGQEKFYELVTHLNKHHDIAIIMVSHEINIVFKYSDDVLCLKEGKVCCHGGNNKLDIVSLEEIYGKNFALHNHQH